MGIKYWLQPFLIIYKSYRQNGYLVFSSKHIPSILLLHQFLLKHSQWKGIGWIPQIARAKKPPHGNLNSTVNCLVLTVHRLLTDQLFANCMYDLGILSPFCTVQCTECLRLCGLMEAHTLSVIQALTSSRHRDIWRLVSLRGASWTRML